jgi:hypothetical protein
MPILTIVGPKSAKESGRGALFLNQLLYPAL